MMNQLPKDRKEKRGRKWLPFVLFVYFHDAKVSMLPVLDFQLLMIC